MNRDVKSGGSWRGGPPSPEEFQRQWQALRPGYGPEVLFYPDRTPWLLADGEQVATAVRAGELMALPADARLASL